MTDLWYRFNVFAERQFFENNNLVDGLIVPAHVIAYYEVSFPQFLKDCSLPFLVDPVSYVWNIGSRYTSNENGTLKKSYEKLVEKLDCKVGNLLGRQTISDAGITKADFEEFVSKVLSFQLSFSGSKKAPRLQSLERLKERIRLVEGLPTQTEEKQNPPYALIPPYFFFDDVTDDAYDKTLYAAQFAQSSNYAKDYKIFPCLCMNRSLLRNESQLQKILVDFKGFKGILLWISGFEEASAPQQELNALTIFVNQLNLQGSEVVNLYGGYFSLLLKYAGLSKVSAGICYSSSRKVLSEPTGGGLPVRYYEPTLKIKIMRENMYRLYSDQPKLFNCECPICSEFSKECREVKEVNNSEKAALLNRFFIQKKSSNTSCAVDLESSRLHFLQCRKTEKEKIENASISAIIRTIEELYEFLQKNDVDPFRYGFDSYDHLRSWANALKILQ